MYRATFCVSSELLKMRLCTDEFRYLGDENTISFQHIVAVMATSEKLPYFSAEGLRDALAHQMCDLFRAMAQVGMPLGESIRPGF